MLKKDLKDGMILQLRNRKRYLLTNGTMRSLDGFMHLADYSEDLKLIGLKTLDIVKVYKDTMAFSLKTMFEDKYLSLLWERKEVDITNGREIEILKALNTLGFNWFARDRNGTLYAHKNKPEKLTNNWFDDNYYKIPKKDNELFNFIKWTDIEPTKIDDLLKEV